MKKIDLKKELKHLYLPSAKEVVIVDVPAFNFIMMDGMMPAGVHPGDSPEYVDSLTALYGISYGLKFKSKLREVNPIDYTVMALEGLWWVESGDFEFGKMEPWFFTSMMLQPDHITQEMYAEARDELQHKKPDLYVDSLRFDRFEEGRCIQIMHVGPYSDEPRTLAKMEAFMKENGYRFRGKHHEIYIGDPRRAKPENLKTVLRHPVSKT
ncbi:MAG: GyrI-like domain-containing protein [Anaerolineales bacterium]